MTNKQKKNLSKYRKKVLKHFFLRWLLPLYLAWQCGYNMNDNKYLYKYLHEVDLVHHYVKIMHDTHEDDMDMFMGEYRCHIQETNKYIEMRDYAYKLERRLKIKGK